ncbi:MAG: GNAT family N-acetyltransferase [Anaerolineae bacterium]|nr:GNAT family N-acetyltransferase [Anaerolineae bacterium]
MSWEIVPLRPEHAEAVAAIHAEGQPGTFLTSLGMPFLRALYTAMASSPSCLGFVAVEKGEVIGIVVGTLTPGSVFKELLLGEGPGLILSTLGALFRHPRLIPRVLQTALYPGQAHAGPGEAEVLYFGVRADRRGEGIGRALFGRMIEVLRERGARAVGLTVDESNQVAKRFYRRWGMTPVHTFTLYGRAMTWYTLPLGDER